MSKRNDPPYLLTVLSGPNAGAELGLSGAKKTLGGNALQDIQLDGLPGEAARFMLDRNQLVVKPFGGVEIVTRDGATLSPERSTKLPLPAQITVDGQTSLHICRMHAPQGAVSRRVPILAAAAAVIALIGFGFSTLLSTSGFATASTAPFPQSVTETQSDTPVVVAAGCANTCVEDAEAAFRKLVADAELLGVTVVSEGTILRVSTQGLAAGDARWAKIRATYDRVWSTRVPLLVERAVPLPKAPFTVQSVYLGERPEVTTRDGEVFRIGSTVPGGWTIAAIEAGSIDLKSGETLIRIEF